MEQICRLAYRGVYFVLTSMFTAEIFGGISVDKGQVFLAVVLHAVVMLFWIKPYFL